VDAEDDCFPPSLMGFRESALRASRALPGVPLKAAAGLATTTAVKL
jgi:hypothetical protein